jgi:hypothetical protein
MQDMKKNMYLKCLWCFNSEPVVKFEKKAHTIPKSLGGQNYNNNVCDSCNSYFGNKQENDYSIEEALKEAFNITRKRLLDTKDTRRKVGRFKSRFFEIKDRKGKLRVNIKPTFRFNQEFQRNLCKAFKRGLYKMYFEELNRQKKIGYEEKYNVIREYARFNNQELPVFYFYRKVGIMTMFSREAETPILFFDRMKYLYSNEKFTEIEFLGHVFGFPITRVTNEEIQKYVTESTNIKKEHFTGIVSLDKLTEIDLTLKIMNK